jgi:very-short-patch-repair endonuclease
MCRAPGTHLCVSKDLDMLLAIARARHGVCTRWEAFECGLTRSSLRTALASGVLRAPVPGVLVVAGAPDTWHQRLSIATLAGRGTAVVSHRAAATLHRFDGASFGGVEVTVPRGHRLPWLVDATVHQTTRFDAADVTVVDGVRVTTVARTLADLGAVTWQDDVHHGLDTAVRRDISLHWVMQTLERVTRPGPTGTGVLRRSLGERETEVGTPESVFERRLLSVLCGGDLPRPVSQHDVRDRQGRIVGRLDFAYPQWRVGVEAHSRRHHDGWARVQADLERDGRLTEMGWHLVYVVWSQLRDPDRVRSRLRLVLSEAGWDPRTGEPPRV